MAFVRHLVRFLPFLAPALAYGNDGDAIEGGLHSAIAPWGIPDPALAAVLSAPPNATGKTETMGFNISSDASYAPSANWALKIDVYGPVSLAGARRPPLDLSQGASLDSDTFAMTVMALSPPDPDVLTAKSVRWKVCAAVISGLAAANTRQASDQNDDGDCARAISDRCAADLHSAILTATGNGTSCRPPKLPASCGDDIPADHTAWAFDLNQAVLTNQSFFVYGASPSERTNGSVQLAEAKANVWPVLLTWSHQSADGVAGFSQLRCLRTETETGPSAGGGGDGGSGSGSGNDSGGDGGDRQGAAGSGAWEGSRWLVALAGVAGVALLL